MVGRARNRTLDGVRGCLAVLVLVHHLFSSHGTERGNSFLYFSSAASVWVFFVLSACVLTKSWDGRYLVFLARRFVRLWPLYALCVGGGYALQGIAPSLPQFFWMPITNTPPVADPPAWSLVIEAWAMLAMPLFVLVGRASFAWLVIALLGTFIAGEFYPYAIFAGFFFVGAWLSRYELRWTVFEGRVPQWLGRISYPLYLSHVPVLWYLDLPPWLSLPLAFAVAQLLTLTVEKWSIAASRAILPRRRPASQAVLAHV
jgi:peptidoglycan/LPS O-acetylase OafA/YrhL